MQSKLSLCALLLLGLSSVMQAAPTRFSHSRYDSGVSQIGFDNTNTQLNKIAKRNLLGGLLGGINNLDGGNSLGVENALESAAQAVGSAAEEIIVPGGADVIGGGFNSGHVQQGYVQQGYAQPVQYGRYSAIV
ncbi:hypothetical protein MBANPS3_008770 [Mucor bainieri]